jgi:GNAT superfamily N-acetyltransferase
MFNRAIGLAEQPGRLAEARAFFDANGVAGELTLAPEDVPPAVEIALRLDAYLDAPDAIDPRPVEGLVIRPVGATSGETWMSVIVASYRPDPVVADLWRSMAPFVAANPRRRLLLGELDGRLVAASSIQATDDGAWLSWAGVLPEARGRGIQRAMIGARARLTAELGCDAIAAWALAGAHSSANLAASGLAPIGQRVSVRAADLG